MNARTTLPAAFGLVAAGALILTGCASSAPATADGDGLNIVTTTTQVTDFVGNLTEGTGATVTALLQPGASAHSFEATPADLVAISEADVVISSGYGLESWLDEVLAAAGYDGPTIEAADGFDPEMLHDDAADSHGHDDATASAPDDGDESGEADDAGAAADEAAHDPDEADHADDGHDHADHGHDHADHGHDDGADDADHGASDADGADHGASDADGADHGAEDDDHGAEDADHGHDDGAEDADHGADDGDHDDHGHDHGGTDPHVWTAPLGAAYMVETIAHGLADLDADGAETYLANETDYLGQLEALDLWISENVAQVAEADRLLVTNHHALTAYADSYGITIVGSIMPSWDDNAEPSAQELDALIATIKASGVTAVFSETQISAATAERIANEAGVAVYSGENALSTDALGATDSPTGTYIGATVHNTQLLLDSWGAEPTALPEGLRGA